MALKWAKTLKKQRNKTSNFFCACAFPREEKISVIKIAYLMLNFLNLKSLLSTIELFFSSIQPQNTVSRDYSRLDFLVGHAIQIFF